MAKKKKDKKKGWGWGWNKRKNKQRDTLNDSMMIKSSGKSLLDDIDDGDQDISDNGGDNFFNVDRSAKRSTVRNSRVSRSKSPSGRMSGYNMGDFYDDTTSDGTAARYGNGESEKVSISIHDKMKKRRRNK